MYEYMLTNEIIERFFPEYFMVFGKRFDVRIHALSEEVDHDLYSIRIDNRYDINVSFRLALPKHVSGKRCCMRKAGVRNYIYQACLPPVFQTSKLFPGLSVLPWEGREPTVVIDGSNTKKLFSDVFSKRSILDTTLEIPITPEWYQRLFGSETTKTRWYLDQEEWEHLFDLALRKELPDYSDVENWFILDGREVVPIVIARKMEETIRRLHRSGAIPGSNIKFALIDLFASHMFQDVIPSVNSYTEDKLITPYFRWNTPGVSDSYVKNNPYISFAATKQDTDAGKIVMLNSGVSIKSNRFVIDQELYKPVPKLLCTNPFILRMEPHRYPIARTLYTQALPVVGENDPVLKVNNTEHIPAANMLVARMVWSDRTEGGVEVSTTEDGAIISETAARRLGCFKKYRIKREISLHDKIEHVNPELLFLEEVRTRYENIDDFDEREVARIKPGDDLVAIRKTNGDTHTIKADIPVSGTATKYAVCKTTRNDTETRTIVIDIVSYYKLEVGDKISDLHTNKCTVGLILPDDKMPTLDGTPMDIIMEPWMGSRCNPSADMEAAMGLWCLETTTDEEQSLVEINPYDEEVVPGMEEVIEITGSDRYNIRTLESKGKEYRDVSVGYMRIMRIDQLAKEKYRSSHNLKLNEAGITRRGVGNLRVPEFAIFARAMNAQNMLSELMQSTKSTKIPDLVRSFTGALGLVKIENTIRYRGAFISEQEAIDKKYVKITKQIDRKKYFSDEIDLDLLQKVMNGGEEDTRNTVLDQDLKDTPGYFVLPEGIKDPFGNPTTKGKNCVVFPAGYIFSVDTPDGEVVGPLQKAFNRVVAEVNYYRTAIADNPDADKKLHEYKMRASVTHYFESIARTLVGKKGMIRQLLLPREEATAWLTLQGHIDSIDTIFVPRRLLEEMLRNEEVRNAYDAKQPEDFEDKYVLATRTPPHKFSHVIALKMKVDDTIEHCARVHDCITSSYLLGDKDGDMLFLRFARKMETLDDYQKFDVWQHSDSFGGSKYLSGVEMSESSVYNRMMESKGKSSSITSIDNEEKISGNWDFIAEADTMTYEEVDSLQRQAAYDYYVVKMGTAECGSLGNMLRVLLPSMLGEDSMRSANDVYHISAQNALDSKKESDMKFKELVTLLNGPVIPHGRVCQCLEDLNAEEQTVKDISLLIEELSIRNMSIKDATCNVAPIMMATQTSSLKDPISAITVLKDWTISKIEEAYSICV